MTHTGAHSGVQLRRAPDRYDRDDQSVLRAEIERADRSNLKSANFQKTSTQFTPTFSASGTPPTGVTYSSQFGFYSRHGDLLFFRLRLILTSKGSGGTGDVVIGGLPLISADNIVTPCATFCSLINLSAGYTQLTAYVDNAATTIHLRESGDNVAHQDVAWAAAADTSDFYIAGFYHV